MSASYRLVQPLQEQRVESLLRRAALDLVLEVVCVLRRQLDLWHITVGTLRQRCTPPALHKAAYEPSRATPQPSQNYSSTCRGWWRWFDQRDS